MTKQFDLDQRIEELTLWEWFLDRLAQYDQENIRWQYYDEVKEFLENIPEPPDGRERVKLAIKTLLKDFVAEITPERALNSHWQHGKETFVVPAEGNAKVVGTIRNQVITELEQKANKILEGK